MTRVEAMNHLQKHVTSESLIKHCMAVEASMRGYAKIFDQDVEAWGITGLLHDIDFDQYPEEHPAHARELLRDTDLSEEMLTAIEEHGKEEMTLRESLLSKTLFAVDSLSSFIIAYVHVRPDKSFEGIKLKSIKKKYKDKAFARAVNRQYIADGAESLGIELGEHMQNVIKAIEERQKELETQGESLV